MLTVGGVAANAANVNVGQDIVCSSTYASQTIKVNISNEWKSDGASFAAYFFNSQNNKSEWAEVKSQGYMGTFVNIPGDYDYVIFVRLKAGATEKSFDNAWNQTADLRISELNGSYTIKGWEKDANKKDSKGSSDSQTETIKLNISNEWKSDGAHFAAYFFNSQNNENKWEMINQSYMGTFVKIPGDYDYVVFVRLKAGSTEKSFDNAWNKTADLKISELNGSYTINGWELNA